MALFSITDSGSFENLESFLRDALRPTHVNLLHQYGKRGVAALTAATPVDSGLTADSWSYTVSKTSGGYRLSFHNTNIVGGVPLVILLQYGHSTKSGTYVQGIDFINPALQPVMKQLSNELWREVGGK